MAITPHISFNGKNTEATFSFEIEPNGYGCLLQIKSSLVTRELLEFLETMKKMTVKPLSAYSDTWHYLE